MEKVTIENLMTDYLNLSVEKFDFKPSELELEAKISKGKIPLSKLDYNNVISKLLGLGYKTLNDEGELMLRISKEEINKKNGIFQMSNIRVEIDGIAPIQEYCKTNEISKLLNNGAILVEKTNYINKKKYFSAINHNYNIKVDLRGETVIGSTRKIGLNFTDNWSESKKTFRLINRVEFRNDTPCVVHLSIIKQHYEPVFNLQQTNLFQMNETYEIEVEINYQEVVRLREKIIQNFKKPYEELLQSFKKTIQDVLCGIQNTDFPISNSEKENVLKEYYTLINQHEKEKIPRNLFNSHYFIGPSSVTLHQRHIITPDDNVKAPNIRKNYTVTEKTDGERCLLFITKDRIYFINNRMDVIFTGCINKSKVSRTIIDGEYVRFDKNGELLNSYYAFDIYFLGGNDIRERAFFTDDVFGEMASQCRFGELNEFMISLETEAIDKICVRFSVKTFYPKFRGQDIFSCCNDIHKKELDGSFPYNTDGLVFTPMDLGVGATGELDKFGKMIIPYGKSKWVYSLKWKPEKYNTIDFLVTTTKNASGEDEMIPLFSRGTNLTTNIQTTYYKQLILRCGYIEKRHGYLNPFQDLLDDKLVTSNEEYRPVQFFPTEPSDPKAGILHMILKKDSKGNFVMKTEENEVFGDNMIIECYYDKLSPEYYKWKPLRVRYDKTAEFRSNKKNFGNDYDIANDNWHSINRPVTEEMIYEGTNIPTMYTIEESIYYNTTDLKTNILKNMRIFHNVIKTKLVGIARKGETLIDYACGKGGDLPKWERAGLSFVFGIDISKDNLENRLDGSCARYLDMKKKLNEVPGALFVLGDSSKNIKTTEAMMNDKSKLITNAVFAKIPKKNLDKMVEKYYGIGKSGFNISSCQFAIHYMFKDETSLFDFLQNVSECTHINGYFIGTCYDGETIFNKLLRKKMDESIVIKSNDTKIWSITKKYDMESFLPDKSGLGLRISVFQESINNEIDEYLVNFTYLKYLLEHYGFALISQSEASRLGFPSPSNMFGTLCEPRDNLSEDAKKISFLNRYFIFKKVNNVNAKEVTNALLRGNEDLSVEEIAEEIAEAEEILEKPIPKELIMADDLVDAEQHFAQLSEPELFPEVKVAQEIPNVLVPEVAKVFEKLPKAKNDPKCKCIKADGSRCTNNAKLPSEYCGMHKNCKNPMEEVVEEVVEVPEVVEKAKTKRVQKEGVKTKRVPKEDKVQCHCIKANGDRCTLNALPNSEFCGTHKNCKNPIK